ncbi:MAG: tetratricopeptide repeat protein, partial [Acidobacteria bacterium]|nr:tetratricopeptide repeat protein [Acidobacteriota bacterium]
MVEYHLSLSDTLSGQGKISEAIDECRKAVNIEPGNPRTHHWVGSTLYSQYWDWKARGSFGQYEVEQVLDDAIEAYREAV